MDKCGRQAGDQESLAFEFEGHRKPLDGFDVALSAHFRKKIGRATIGKTDNRTLRPRPGNDHDHSEAADSCGRGR